MKLYCTKCGGATEYMSQKPNFCSRCGVSLGAAVTGQKPEFVPDEDDFEEVDAGYILDGLESLDVEIIDTSQERGIKFGEALGTHAGQDLEGLNREPDPSAIVSEEEFVKQFKREAGGIKNKPERPKKNQRNRNNGRSKT